MARVLAALALVFGATTPATASATDYVIQTIADSSTSVNRLGLWPQVDNQGFVYFDTYPDSLNVILVRATPDQITPLLNYYGELQSVSGSGNVVVNRNESLSGGPLTTIIDGVAETLPTPPDDFQLLATTYNRAWINNSGTVAFSGYTKFSPPISSYFTGIFNSDDVTTPLVTTEPPSPIENLHLSDWEIPQSIAFNNLGNVAFIGYTANGAEIIVADPAGNLTPQYTNPPPPNEVFGLISESLDMNDHGEIVFGGFPVDGSPAGIYTLLDGKLTEFGNSGGAFGDDFLTVFDINNNGEIVFQNKLDNGAHGIFDGPDPVANKVIMEGDSLAGSTVKELRFYHGLNDAGQITFSAILTDGRIGIFRADPIAVPEPSTLALAGIGVLGLLAHGVRRRFAA